MTGMFGRVLFRTTARRPAQPCLPDEASIGATHTNELAVMMDSFRPLKVAKAALPLEDPGYHKSWIDQQHAAFNPPTS